VTIAPSTYKTTDLKFCDEKILCIRLNKYISSLQTLGCESRKCLKVVTIAPSTYKTTDLKFCDEKLLYIRPNKYTSLNISFYIGVSLVTIGPSQ